VERESKEVKERGGKQVNKQKNPKQKTSKNVLKV
jgi:hypothetical protein